MPSSHRPPAFPPTCTALHCIELYCTAAAVNKANTVQERLLSGAADRRETRKPLRSPPLPQTRAAPLCKQLVYAVPEQLQLLSLLHLRISTTSCRSTSTRSSTRRRHFLPCHRPMGGKASKTSQRPPGRQVALQSWTAFSGRSHSSFANCNYLFFCMLI